MSEKLPLPKKPKGAVPIFLWWLKKLFLVGARTYCPRCEKGHMFESYFKVRKQCPECKVVLQPYPGDELGVVALGHFLSVASGNRGGLFLYRDDATPTPSLLLGFNDPDLDRFLPYHQRDLDRVRFPADRIEAEALVSCRS